MLELTYYLILAGIAFGFMTMSWLIQLLSKNSNIIDVCWSFAIGACALYLFFSVQPQHLTAYTVLVLGTLWSLRLGTHLLLNRVVLSQEEDTRYQKLRADCGKGYNHFVLWFVWFQALTICVFIIPFILVCQEQQSSFLLICIGICVAATSIVGVFIADQQLERWKNNPNNKGRTCNVGLWHYSRHPNYFFEWLYWCSYPIICWPLDYGYLAILVPVFELWLLLKMTGIPYTERCSLANRSDYASYQKLTSPFFPWFPRKEA